ncbi:TetR/AcrR family transcriptional regulator [Allobranchiibius huperziae]|uniref:AcrR family transcriptional regulator n=1 Tax=Allobranchiibius huperziae TaxID=1874116 RepID=A0A853DG42_9MICO|nr:TetR/AcrR family transcriptional regulator [Allobranchiibius huperziae]NYJ76502.1 AcrR family transcriptional regulator [Allobranchiibius huperziae]
MPDGAKLPPSARTPRRHGATSTRAAILDAAEALFAERGYPASTIAEIARRAGVGTNTVYVGFANKAGIVTALIEQAADAASARASLEDISLATDGDQVIEALARGTRMTHERFHDVVTIAFDTANADPLIGHAMQAAIDGYRDRLHAAVTRIRELGALTDALTVPEAVDLLWFYLGLPPWRTVIDMGWTWDRAELFLATGAKRALLR